MTRTITRRAANVATLFAAALPALLVATIVGAAYAGQDSAPRTVVIGLDHVEQTPAEWTADVIRDGWAATSAADRARACQATPAQLRAAAPRTSYDPARYDVETAIRTLAVLCK